MQSMAHEESSSSADHHQSPKQHCSIPSGDNSVWADVSPLLSAACRDLQDGELIHGDNFNLYAAMSALEIMDPKMDSGMVSRFYSIDEAIESGVAPVPISSDRTVDVQCIIDIMDHLLACEATWHKGHSLAQTVFSCIYLLRPERTSSHAILHSYCRVIRATCRAVVSAVSDARTNEEEDLFTMTYGLPLNADEDSKGLSLLNAVEETISRQLRACRAPSSKRRALEELEPLQMNLELEESYCKALLCRIRFRKHFLHALNCIRRPQGRGLELARKHIGSCISELDTILKSAEYLRSDAVGTVENDMEERTTSSGHQPVGFDASINKRLSAPTPPRSIKLLSWKKALEYFVKLLHNLDQICSFSLEPDLDAVLRFVVQFQKSEPDLVSRAHLQLLLVQDGKLYGRDPLFAIITRAAALPEFTKNHDIQKNECIVQLGQLVINLLKILCTNTAWQRRKLGKILNDWRIIYVQLELSVRHEFGDSTGIRNSEDISVRIVNHLLNWIQEEMYWIASHFLKLGFELDLYSQSEYCMIYWYMYIILFKLGETTHFKTALAADSAKKKTKKKKDSPKDVVTRETQVSPPVLFVQCQMCLAEGLTMLLAALRNEGMDLPSSGPFNTENEKFMQHFELLQKACIPDYSAYQSFRESTSHACFPILLVYNYFKDAQKMAKDLKSGFSKEPDRLAEVRRLEQVAEHNAVALNLICRVGAVDRSLKVSFEFTHHPYFPTVVVRRS
ncbi:PREDICTED: N-alpha-acetyltransferase 35, NatC auxiliary subunit [Tarenaya hassleriana]|uniref:N-alpha-acetyltransferase 35, NatC auxiliary subunit n=1 Tax=Tarenaya hassleriana TaxID=28532 RepID=UPI00053C8EC9|nr:PREDICTED: N-alpha-acetyltransferase 35, NatC auxiliary subunit [Tarenaya hassleriana]